MYDKGIPAIKSIKSIIFLILSSNSIFLLLVLDGIINNLLRIL